MLDIFEFEVEVVTEAVFVTKSRPRAMAFNLMKALKVIRVSLQPPSLPSCRAMSHSITITTPYNKQIRIPTGLFIDNEFVPSVDSQEVIKHVLVGCLSYIR